MTPYPRPPIREALLDIRVTASKDASLDILASYQNKIITRFPVKEDRYAWTGGFRFKPGSAPDIVTPSGGQDGFFFRSDEEKKVTQVRKDGFTFNKLSPYQNWDVFQPEARALWEHYVEIVKPEQVTRLALRYINCIEIPLPLESFKDYLLTAPEVAPNVPQGLTKFFMQLVIPKNPTGMTANVTETMESISAKKNVLPFVLDIDVYKNINLSPLDKKAWDVFNELREFKNLIFKNSVTPRCEALFQ